MQFRNTFDSYLDIALFSLLWLPRPYVLVLQWGFIITIANSSNVIGAFAASFFTNHSVQL